MVLSTVFWTAFVMYGVAFIMLLTLLIVLFIISERRSENGPKARN